MTDDARAGLLAAHPECEGWAVVALPYASRTKKGVLGAYTWGRRWAETECRSAWVGTPRAFAFADAEEGRRFAAAVGREQGGYGGAERP